MLSEQKDNLVTLEEFQDILQIGRTTAYQLLNSGEIKAFRIGRFWKIPRAAITEYVSRKSQLDFFRLSAVKNVFLEDTKAPCKSLSRSSYVIAICTVG